MVEVAACNPSHWQRTVQFKVLALHAHAGEYHMASVKWINDAKGFGFNVAD
jgi:hypothetical protein